jgi:hypothetical protein
MAGVTNGRGIFVLGLRRQKSGLWRRLARTGGHETRIGGNETKWKQNEVERKQRWLMRVGKPEMRAKETKPR